jgi:ferrous iron transport protein A
MHLIDVEPGVWAIVSGFEGGDKFQQRLLQHGLYPGDRARILRTAPMRGPLLVEVSGREIAIGRSIAQKILVEVAE